MLTPAELHQRRAARVLKLMEDFLALANHAERPDATPHDMIAALAAHRQLYAFWRQVDHDNPTRDAADLIKIEESEQRTFCGLLGRMVRYVTDRTKLTPEAAAAHLQNELFGEH